MPVFDGLPRSDPSPRNQSESLSRFLTRVHTPYWASVRDLIEDWFSRLPEAAQADVRGRLRSRDDHQFHGAFWELYLHESLIRSGFEVDCHPELAGTSRRPDFLARRDGDAMYVEARTAFASSKGPGDKNRLNQALDALNRLESKDFFIWVEIGAQGDADLKVGPLRASLEAWLATLDADEITQQLKTAGDIDSVQSVDWNTDGWQLIVHPIPKAAGRRRLDGKPAIGVHGPARAGGIDNVTPLKAALSDKGGAYGELDHPLVIAIRYASDISDDFDTVGALYGSSQIQIQRGPNAMITTTEVRAPDGYWYLGDHWAHLNVSGVLIARNLMPWGVATQTPELWHHPDPDRPVAATPDLWRHAVAGRDGLDRIGPARQAWETFDLAQDWPGTEPFEPYR